MYNSSRNSWLRREYFGLRLLSLVCLIVLNGCSNKFYKEDADKEVQSILDARWSDEYGPQANTRISDVEPHPQDLPREVVLPESGVVGLAKAVEIATANNRQYQQQKESLYLAALGLSLERHEFAVQFFGSVDGGYANDRGTDTESVDGGGNVGFDWLLASGARVTSRFAVDWFRFLTGDPQESLGSVLSVSLVQPLLRGAQREIVQENLTQAERDLVYELRDFSRYRKSFVVDIVDQYYGVLQALDALKNDESNYELRIDSTKRAMMLVEAGKQQRFEADQARQSELSARNSLIRSQQNYQRQLDRFKISLGLPTEIHLEPDPGELMRLRELTLTDPNYPMDDAIHYALENRLDLATDFDRVDDARRKLKVAENNLLARLDLTAGYSVDSDPGKRTISLETNKGAFSLGLEADPDLDRLAERNAYRAAMITLQQRQRSYDEAVDEVKFEVRDSLRRLQEAAQSYVIQQQSVELAQTRVDSTNMLLQAGRADTRDLLESQDALLSAQNQLTSALINHTIAKLEFYRDIELLQVRPDGLWEQSDAKQASTVSMR